ncbi:MAG TPA: lytic transglycosylase domain-containing protein [Candidatus Eremiobacteraceae bacterium]|nr:lytic transglycosylase domain-containing protein [Candidatus Eremiobacteraceae bacterium]
MRLNLRRRRHSGAISTCIATAAVMVACVSFAAPSRAEYFVMRSGMRLHVSGYQLLDGKYRLQIEGGFVEAPAEDVVAIEPEEVFVSNPPVPAAKSPFRDLIEAAASRYSVDAELIASVIAAESNFNPKAISRRNARGLMQLLPETAARLGVHNIFDPAENIDAGTHYLSDLLTLYRNDLALTLAAYNAGPLRVQQYGRVPPYAETQLYVRRVRTAYAKRKAAVPAGSKTAAVTPHDAAPTPTTLPAGS